MKNCLSKELTIKLIVITSFFIVGFGVEFLYRKPLLMIRHFKVKNQKGDK